MAHQFESGFFVARPAWHQLGTVLKKPPTTEDAIIRAGLDWQVIEEPIVRTEQDNAILQKNLVRDRDRRLLGTVNHDYTPLQNEDAFRWFDPLLEQGDIQLNAAGSLQQGRRVWILAQVKNTAGKIGRNDYVRPYLLLHNSHDGSTAVWLQFTPIRVVCMNTLAGAAAHRFGDLRQRKALCIPHNVNLAEQLDKVQNLVDLTKREFQVCVEEYQAMASQEINQELLSGYFDNVMGPRIARSLSVRQQLLQNFEQGIGNRGKTLWDAYNAITEWIEHQMGSSAEERLLHSWFGNGVRLRRRAHHVALQTIDLGSTEVWQGPKVSSSSNALLASSDKLELVRN
ncbi:MAG: DUF932 domain-containing protein [Cyanobacteria bacterium J06641_5]